MLSPAFFGTAAFAVGAGVATFFAPCAFPLLPGYVGYYLQRTESASGLVSGVVAAAGAVVSLGVVAGLALALGQRLTSLLPVVEPAIGLALVAFGLLVLSGWTAPTPSLPARPESLVGFGAFGAVYAVAAAGCVVPLFLGVVAQASALPPGQGALVLAGYAVAVAAPLVGVTLLADAGVTAWRDAGRYAGRMKQAAGALLVVAGLGQLYLSVVVLDVLGP
ncbi:cytochrome c biogenesis protein CcdA [Halobellus rubicundus]|uniref:Cytochrome c biogenesis protein CcdA n=1 Tax=Halobellus rubicundus TaxID=2996466 RepID=A0ABD5MCH6_9EURY